MTKGALRAGGLLLLSTRAAAQVPEELPDIAVEDLLKPVVSARKAATTTFREAPATVYVITDAMIRDRGYNFLYDALRDAPGINTIWMGGLYGPILMFRGIDAPENNKLLLLVDGVVDNNLSAGTAQVFMQYSLHDVKRIEVIYGPASALFGANAMTGIINIITSNGEDLQGVRGQAGTMTWDPKLRRKGGFFNVVGGQAFGEKGRRLVVDASFNYVYTNGPDLRLDGGPRSDRPADPGGASYYFSPHYLGAGQLGTYMAKLRARYEPLGLTLGGFVSETRAGQGTYYHEGFAGLNGLSNRPDTWNFRNLTAYAKHDWSFGEHVTNSASLVFRTTTLLADSTDAYFNATGTGPDGVGGDGSARYFRPDHSTRLEDGVSLALTDGMSLTVGASLEVARVGDYNKAEGMGETATAFDHQRLTQFGPAPTLDERRRYDYSTLGAYAEHSWSLGEGLSTVVGLRVDRFAFSGTDAPQLVGTADYAMDGSCLPNAPRCVSPADAMAQGGRLGLDGQTGKLWYRFAPVDRPVTTFNPRVGVVFTGLDHKLTLKALYGEGFRPPTVREMFSVSGSRYTNPELLPEKMRSAQLNAIYQVLSWGFVELDGYYNNARDIIQLSESDIKRPGKDSRLNRFQNVGDVQTGGFDARVQLRPTRWLGTFGSYSFLIADYSRIDPGDLSHDTGSSDPRATSTRVPRQPTHLATVGASAYLLGDRLVLTPRVDIVGSRPSIITSPIAKVPAYACLNVSVVLNDLPVKDLYLELVGYNLTHADILDPGFRTAAKSDDFPAAHPQPGLSAFLKVGYRVGL